MVKSIDLFIAIKDTEQFSVNVGEASIGFPVRRKDDEDELGEGPIMGAVGD